MEPNKSLWSATQKTHPESPLTADTTVDVCIVGAGIAGLSTAYMLARAGQTVAVLDDGPIGGGQTQQTTAHLTNAIDDRYLEIERLHGEDGARLAAESHTRAIDQIERNVRDEQIDCEFTRLDGYLFVPPGEPVEILEEEQAAARRAGLADVAWLPRLPLDFHDFGPCLQFPRQGQFHPLKYLSALAKAVKARNGRLFSGTHVEQVEGGAPARIHTRQGPTVTAQAVVIATNVPINDLVVIHTKQAPYRTYAIGASLPRGSVPQALYWDTGHFTAETQPVTYHYIRLGAWQDADLLIVGGEDHKSGQKGDDDAPFGKLDSWARQHFPMIQETVFRWSGQVMEPVDGLAFIGRNPLDADNVFVATGDSGMGMTHGTIAGILLSDLILGRENPWASLYDPSRKTLRSFPAYVRENLNVARTYGRYVSPGEVSSVDEIKPGCGAIVRRGTRKVAAYRDDQGRLHEHLAACTHLGCIVEWNGASKSWDCPCHGSIFDPLGRAINGPANTPLAPLEAETTPAVSRAGRAGEKGT